MLPRICLPIFGGVDNICSRWRAQVKNEKCRAGDYVKYNVGEKRNTELVKMRNTDRSQVCCTCYLALWHVFLRLKYSSDEFSDQQGMTKRPFIATFKQWIRWWYVENSFDQSWSVDQISIVDEHPLSSDHQCSFADCLMHLKVNMVWSGWSFSADSLSRSSKNIAVENDEICLQSYYL